MKESVEVMFGLSKSTDLEFFLWGSDVLSLTESFPSSSSLAYLFFFSSCCLYIPRNTSLTFMSLILCAVPSCQTLRSVEACDL